MSRPRKSIKFITLGVLFLAAAGAVVWNVRAPSPPAVDDAEAQRDRRKMTQLVELKDSSLAALENRDFRTAEPSLLELATVGIGEPIGSRNLLINRISLVGTIDESKQTNDYVEAVERARTALNLEFNLEREGPIRYYLASKIEFLSHNPAKQAEALHIAAGRDLRDPLVWYELYAAERESRDRAARADGESAMKSLYELVPDNLYVLLEWLKIQSRRKDPAIARTLDRAQSRLLPFLGDVPVATPIAADHAMAGALSAAKKGDWSAVALNVTAIDVIASVQPAVRNDKRRVDRGLIWLIKTDFSDKFYREHVFDRVLPKASVPVHFREHVLKGPLALLSDVRAARCVNLKGGDSLEIAVLRNSSLEIYGRGKSPDDWSKLAEMRLPADSFEHLIATELDPRGSDGKTDLVLWGPGGVRLVEDRGESKDKTRSLDAIETPALSRGTKNALGVALVDLDHDGALDLVVTHRAAGTPSTTESGVLSIWRNAGRLQFVDVTARSGLAEQPRFGRSLVAVDWNRDFDMDVLMAVGDSTSAGVGLLQGVGEGRFRFQPLAIDNPVFQGSRTLAILDADANGSPDLLVGSPNGLAIAETSSTQPGEVNVLGTNTISDFPADGLCVFDYDNDGSQDLVAWNGNEVRCFHGGGNGRFDEATDVLPATVKAPLSVEAGDIDGDGDLDLLVVSRDATGGRLEFLENDGGNANNWIDVHLASATGALLQLKTGVVSQSRVVSAPLTHFGIGKLPSADILRIVWPTGIPTDILDPPKNRTIQPTPAPSANWASPPVGEK